MPDSKISALTEGTVVDLNNDFLVYVDSSDTTQSLITGTTKKLKPANLPISTPIQTALDLKLGQTFETVSKNLKGYPTTLNYTSGALTSIVYTIPSGTITKTLNYISEVLSSIVLSGNTPDGISLTKTLNYTAGQLLSIGYS